MSRFLSYNFETVTGNDSNDEGEINAAAVVG